MRYVLRLSVGLMMLWTSAGCSISHEIQDTEPPPDQPPLSRLEEQPRPETERPEQPAEGETR